PIEAPAERAALTHEVLLADELLEIGRAHPGGEWLAPGRRSEERLRLGALRRSTWHAASLRAFAAAERLRRRRREASRAGAWVDPSPASARRTRSAGRSRRRRRRSDRAGCRPRPRGGGSPPRCPAPCD